jgi:putative ABC transport system permease protein
MNVRRLFSAIGGAAANSIVLLLSVAAFILSPFRVGRLLRVVSIPRMREHQLRTTLTAAGIAVGVASLVAVTIVNRSILRGVESTVDDLAGKTDLQVGAGSIGFDEGLLEKIETVKDVHASTPVLQQTAMIHDPRGIRERILILGADFLGESDSYFRTYASTELTEIKRDPIPFLNSPTNIIISRTLADRMGYKLHDKIPIVTTEGVQQFDIWGFVENQGVGRAFGGSVGFMYYAGMQVAFGRGHNIDRVDVAVTPGVDAELVKQTLSGALGAGIVVERPARKGERISNMLTSFRMALLMASAIALVVGTFLIYNTMAISVVQRKRELGILRAIGTTRRQLLLLLTLEGALLGIVSSSIGLLVGIALARGLLRITSEALSEAYLQVAVSDLQIDPGFIAVSFLLGTLAATVAAALPAYRASAKSPVQMLRTGGLTTSYYGARIVRTDVIGLLLLPASWLLLHATPVGGLPLGAIAALMTLLLAGSLLLPRFIQHLHHRRRADGGRRDGHELRDLHPQLHGEPGSLAHPERAWRSVRQQRRQHERLEHQEHPDVGRGRQRAGHDSEDREDPPPARRGHRLPRYHHQADVDGDRAVRAALRDHDARGATGPDDPRTSGGRRRGQ